MTLNGINAVIEAIEKAGWLEVVDNNNERTLVCDIDRSSDDDTAEYLVEDDAVTLMVDGLRKAVIWTRSEPEDIYTFSGIPSGKTHAGHPCLSEHETMRPEEAPMRARKLLEIWHECDGVKVSGSVEDPYTIWR